MTKAAIDSNVPYAPDTMMRFGLLLLAALAVPPSGTKYRLERVRDEASGLVAFTYLVPDGWTPHHAMRWPSPGAFQASLSAASADGHYAVAQFERMVVSGGEMRNPQTGAPLDPNAHAIRHATDFLRTLVEGMKRQYGVDEMEVMESTDQPLAPPPGSFGARPNTADPMGSREAVSEAGFLQVRFTLKGVPTVAALGTTIAGSVSTKHLPGRPNMVTSVSSVFVAGPSTVVMGPESPSPARVREMRTIASSMAPTPAFLAFFQKLGARLAGATLRANIDGQIASNIGWHERSMAHFRGEMDRKSALSRQFCNYLQDQQDYRDPSTGAVVTLPAVNHAWTDGQGHYILSDEPGVGVPGDWKPLPKVRVGG